MKNEMIEKNLIENGFEIDENDIEFRFEQFSISFNRNENVVDSYELCMKNSETREIWICDIDGLNVLYEIIENALDLDFGFERL